MKVGFNARYLYDPGLRGFNRYTLCLLRALQEIPGVEICLVSEERYPVHELYRSALRAQVMNLSASKTLLWEQWSLPRYLKKLRPDVFHAPAEGGLPGWKVCPYVLTWHGVPSHSLTSLLESGELDGKLDDYLDFASRYSSRAGKVLERLRSALLCNLHVRAADLVIAVSEFSKQELVRYLRVPPDKIRVIYEAADDVFARPLPAEQVDMIRVKHGIPPRFVLFVGGFDRRKNISTLLLAFATVRRTNAEVALVLVGIGGNIESARRQSAAVGLREGQHVFFLPRLPDLELAALYRAASLFTTLSWHEGFCLPVVEAMTCGTPVLCSNRGAIPEIVAAAGWLVDPRRFDEIVDAMRTILDRGEVRAELRSRGLTRSKFFSWERTARETLSAYHDLCGTPV